MNWYPKTEPYHRRNRKSTHADDPYPFARPGSREHSHPARGGGRIPAAGDAVFDRQGLLGDGAAGAEGVSPRPDPVPAAARRHHLQVPAR